MVACEGQMYVQWSLLSLRKITEEEKPRLEIRLHFAGYYCGQTLHSVLIIENFHVYLLWQKIRSRNCNSDKMYYFNKIGKPLHLDKIFTIGHS